ncbi:hypothetical protein DIURU_004534 [Diutina rugosa]|uniref:Uncharacterized protein n=1 Tax=Diutina rugosa TaxID=5481 RepID=A0A642UGU8_DIURU|nr:uncharacterized protein DIURU_004534 [Diutina rugosa]KAA8898690.1 hypothetical protein DIURU_004534 [Diutina rugosa]
MHNPTRFQSILRQAYRNATTGAKVAPTPAQIRQQLLDQYQTSVYTKYFDPAAIEASPVLTVDDLTSPIPNRKVVIGGQELSRDRVQSVIDTVKQSYLHSKPDTIDEENATLKELQQNVFGVKPLDHYHSANLDDVVDADFIKAMMFIANLKINKYNTLHPNHHIEMPLKVGIEDFPVMWHYDNLDEAVKEIRGLKSEQMDMLPLKLVIPWVKMSLATKLFEQKLDRMQQMKDEHGEAGTVEQDFLQALADHTNKAKP